MTGILLPVSSEFAARSIYPLRRLTVHAGRIVRDAPQIQWRPAVRILVDVISFGNLALMGSHNNVPKEVLEKNFVHMISIVAAEV